MVEDENTAGPYAQLWGALTFGLAVQVTGILINRTAESEAWLTTARITVIIGSIIALIGAIGFGVVLGLRAREEALKL